VHATKKKEIEKRAIVNQKSNHMNTTTIGFIGGGRITKIFLQAFRNKSVLFKETVVYDPNQEICKSLKSQFSDIQIAKSVEQTAKQDLVVLAVHPPVIMETLNAIKGQLQNNATILSLAPKITIAKIEELLNTKEIARMIPNATSYINKGYNPVSFHPTINAELKKNLMQLFASLGEIFEVKESQLEAYAIISAMLPTYFWFQWEEIEKLGVKMGLNEDECRQTIYETLKVSLDLFYKSELNHSEVIDLIPVKPVAEMEEFVKKQYEEKLVGLFNKIKP